MLHPTAETAWADLRLLDEQMGGVWNDQDVLEAESKILVSLSFILKSFNVSCCRAR